ncbi:hypothetical protein FACS1894110_09730 [Spirochaetia bacterium]|nr:hypothetical protein FACS1894110_09730 [Spirochaetia bacterium]
MTEVLSTLINKLPVTYIEFMLPVLAAAGVWVFSHIRRDKQGKIIWFSAKYEAKKSQRKLDCIAEGIAYNRTELLRLQILQCIDHRPDEIETICHLYAEYKGRPDNPNGYIDRRFNEWRKKTGQGETA